MRGKTRNKREVLGKREEKGIEGSEREGRHLVKGNTRNVEYESYCRKRENRVEERKGRKKLGEGTDSE